MTFWGIDKLWHEEQSIRSLSSRRVSLVVSGIQLQLFIRLCTTQFFFKLASLGGGLRS